MNEIRPHYGPQERFLATPADIGIYGGAAGSGKSWALLLEPLRNIANPKFGAVIFRRTYPQVTQEGGLWDQSFALYGPLGGVPNLSDLYWTFPAGSRVSFAHLQHEKNVLDWQGSQIPLIGFDELTHFTARQFWYMLSRNRSTCGVRPYIRATCNADADSWVADLIAWWIDQDSGFPVAERAGVLRWFVRVGETLEWADDPAELRARHPAIEPKSLTFIPGQLSDNPTLEEADPGYRANLMALPLVDRERLLGGNWKIRPSAGKVLNRAWFRIVDASPAGARRVRYWDKAGTEDGGKFTAGVLAARTPEGLTYFEDVVRGQWSAGQRETVIAQVAEADRRRYGSVEIWIEQEPGSGGKESAEFTIMNLAGHTVRADRVTGDKVQRAGPLSAQAEAGNVRLVRGDWNEAFLAECHAFPDGPYKDQVDAAAGAFNRLALPHRKRVRLTWGS